MIDTVGFTNRQASPVRACDGPGAFRRQGPDLSLSAGSLTGTTGTTTRCLGQGSLTRLALVLGPAGDPLANPASCVRKRGRRWLILPRSRSWSGRSAFRFHAGHHARSSGHGSNPCSPARSNYALLPADAHACAATNSGLAAEPGAVGQAPGAPLAEPAVNCGCRTTRRHRRR